MSVYQVLNKVGKADKQNEWARIPYNFFLWKLADILDCKKFIRVGTATASIQKHNK